MTLSVIELVILICGTLFAWYNWILVLQKKCTTCSIEVHENPFLSKCFWGALFFTAALMVQIIAMY